MSWPSPFSSLFSSSDIGWDCMDTSQVNYDDSSTLGALFNDGSYEKMLQLNDTSESEAIQKGSIEGSTETDTEEQCVEASLNDSPSNVTINGHSRLFELSSIVLSDVSMDCTAPIEHELIDIQCEEASLNDSQSDVTIIGRSRQLELSPIVLSDESIGSTTPIKHILMDKSQAPVTTCVSGNQLAVPTRCAATTSQMDPNQLPSYGFSNLVHKCYPTKTNLREYKLAALSRNLATTSSHATDELPSQVSAVPTRCHPIICHSTPYIQCEEASLNDSQCDVMIIGSSRQLELSPIVLSDESIGSTTPIKHILMDKSQAPVTTCVSGNQLAVTTRCAATTSQMDPNQLPSYGFSNLVHKCYPTKTNLREYKLAALSRNLATTSSHATDELPSQVSAVPTRCHPIICHSTPYIQCEEASLNDSQCDVMIIGSSRQLELSPIVLSDESIGSTTPTKHILMDKSQAPETTCVSGNQLAVPTRCAATTSQMDPNQLPSYGFSNLVHKCYPTKTNLREYKLAALSRNLATISSHATDELPSQVSAVPTRCHPIICQCTPYIQCEEASLNDSQSESLNDSQSDGTIIGSSRQLELSPIVLSDESTDRTTTFNHSEVNESAGNQLELSLPQNGEQKESAGNQQALSLPHNGEQKESAGNQQELSLPHNGEQKESAGNQQELSLPHNGEQKESAGNQQELSLPHNGEQKESAGNQQELSLPHNGEQKELAGNQQELSLPHNGEQKESAGNQQELSLSHNGEQKESAGNQQELSLPHNGEQKESAGNQQELSLPHNVLLHISKNNMPSGSRSSEVAMGNISYTKHCEHDEVPPPPDMLEALSLNLSSSTNSRFSTSSEQSLLKAPKRTLKYQEKLFGPLVPNASQYRSYLKHDEPDDIPDFQSWFHRKRTNTYGAFNSLPAAKRVCNRDATPASSSRIAVNPISQNSVINHTAARPPHINQWLSRFQQWSKVEQTEALISLIDNCNAGQVRYMMRAIEPMFQRDFISLLPKELALNVLRYLEPKDLLRAAQTCTAWRVLADDHLLWKEQCARIGLDTHKKPRTVSHTSPWKAAYMRQYMIESNWLNKPVDEPKRMPGHEDHVITCLQFHGNRILSGSDDTTLRVWCASNGKLLRILKGHTGGVWSSQMVGDLVISGSTDRTLRVWDAKTGACLKVLYGHTSTVRCMHIHDTSVVSGSRDATLRVWSIPDGRCLQVLVGHLAAVRCVQFDGKVVVSGAYDFFVKVWDPVNGACLHTLAGHTNRVYSLQFDGVHVVSGSLDTSIRVWDVETGRLKHTLIGHQSLTSGMELRNNILVSGNADSTVKVWDINTGQCLHTLSGPNKHQSAVTCLQTSNRFVITSSDDGTVKLWDVNSGEFIRDLVKLDSGGSGGVVWRIRASATKLICAVGSRNGTEETKLLVLDFDVPGACAMCDQ